MQRHRGIFTSDSSPKSYLHLSTNNIVFQLTDPSLKTITSSSSLRVTNTSQSPLQYKIKSTAPFLYLVKPFEGIIQPKQSIRISIKLILGERSPIKFNHDKFEILAKPYDNNSNSKSKEFWIGAQRHRLSVELVQVETEFHQPRSQYETQEYKTMNSQAINRYQTQDLKSRQGINNHFVNQHVNEVTERQVDELEVEVNRRRQRVDKLKENKRRGGLLTTKNLIIVGFVSFITGILFT